MKTLFLILFMSVHPFSLPTVQEENLTAIAKAMSDGDAVALSNYFDQSVEIAVLDQEDIYDKGKAVQVLKAFFAKNKPKSYNQVHQGTSKGKDSQYVIGNLQTTTTNFRVYLYLKTVGTNLVIQEMRFDKE